VKGKIRKKGEKMREKKLTIEKTLNLFYKHNKKSYITTKEDT
jgi:hypothetical protein